MAKLQQITFASLPLCCAVACYSGPADSSKGPMFTSSSSQSDDGAEIVDSAEAGDGSDASDSADSSDASDSADSSDSSDSGDTGTPVADLGTSNADPNEVIPPPDKEGCHAIYAQDLLPTFELTIQPAVWELLEWQWDHGKEFKGMEEDSKQYHPLQEFRYGDIVIQDAEIRLRGNEKNWDPIPDDKMQFQIGFHRNDAENGHFLGIKRLCFDAHGSNQHMLRDRLSLAIIREAGIAAACANNARLVINGEYYGIFTNVEKIDEVFLERVFDDPTGDLWKRKDWTLKTNKDNSNDDRIEMLNDAESLEEIYTYLKLEQAVRVYAADALMPNGDGSWGGGLNFYLYDDPIDGKFWLLPWDMDNTFDRFKDPPNGEYPLNPDPINWERLKSHGRPWFDAAIDDDIWFEYYISQIDEILHEGYTPEKMHGRIDEMTAQIEDAVLEDENKPWSNEDYLDEVENLHEYVEQHYYFVEEWLECWKEGGEKDKDGYCDPP